MAGVLLLPFFELLGVELAALAEGYIASSVVTAGANYVGGQVSEKIDEKVKQKVSDALPDWVKDLPSEVQEDLKRVLGFMVTGDNSAILEKAKKDQQADDFKEVQEEELVGSYTQPTQGLTIRTKKPTDSAIFIKDIAKSAILSDDTKQEIRSLNIVDPLPLTIRTKNYKPPVVEPPKPKPVVYQKAFGPRDLAHMVIDTSRELANTLNPVTAALNVLAIKPQTAPLFNKMSAYLSTKKLPDTEEYRKIAAIYNGRNIDFNNFSIKRNNTTKLIEVTGIDETGTPFTLPQTTGVVLPAVPGTTFMGPRSANDRLPTFDRVEDFFSFFHDYNWFIGGNFNREGDLKFISRLSQNLDRVKPENRALVEATIIYFTNVSLTLGMLMGEKEFGVQPLPNNDAVVEEEEEEEIPFGIPVDDETPPEGVETGDFFDVLTEDVDIPYAQRDAVRKEFYDVMNEEMTYYQREEGFLTVYRENYVEKLLDEIEIWYN